MMNFKPSTTAPILIVFILFGLIALPRLAPFPATFLAPDEMKIGVWVSQMGQALAEADWEKTAITNNPYPAVTLAWLELLRAQVRGESANPNPLGADLATVFALMPQRRLTLALLNSLITLAICGLAWRLYGRFVAITAALLMAFDPFLLTESRVYRTEGLTAGLMFLSALTIITYGYERRRNWLIASAMLAGLAILTRVSALYLVPFAGLAVLVWSLPAGQRQIRPPVGRVAGDLALWGLVTGVTFVALWPAFWVAPGQGPDKLYQALAPVFADTNRVWAKGVFFQGRAMGGADPGPVFYLWAFLYRTTPLLWPGLTAAVWAGIIALRRRPAQAWTWLSLPPKWPVTLLIGFYLLFYLAAINLSATKIDRYLVAMLPGLSILAALGFEAGLGRLFGHSAPKAAWGLGAALVIGGLALSWPYRPYYYTYWNPLLGGGRAAVTILPVTFRLGIDPLIDYLNRQPEVDTLKLTGSTLDIDTDCQVIFKGDCLSQEQFLAADYFLLTRYTVQHELGLANIQTLIPDLNPVYKFEHNGVDYAWLYHMPPGLHHVGHWLGDTAGSFLGYRLPATGVNAGDTVEITLYWQNGASNGWRFDDSELYVKLLDEKGQPQQLAPARLQPAFEAALTRPGEVLAFTAPLALDPQTPLGFYTLEMGLRLKATGEETFRFPLGDTPPTVTVQGGALIAGEKVSIPHRLERAIAGAGLTLLGYDLSPSTATAVPPILYLYWQTTAPLTTAYTVQLALADAQGQIVANWHKPLAPAFHPVTAWQPGELVKIPFPLEIGYTLPEIPARWTLSIFGAGQAQALAAIDLPQPPLNFAFIPPKINMQHSLTNVSFGPGFDLAGYDLFGQGDPAAGHGKLLVTLYWLNRQPAVAAEAQVEALGDAGQPLAQQRLAIPPPAELLSWQSAGHYELELTALPSVLVIKVKPVQAETWYTPHGEAGLVGEGVLITNILQKTARAVNP